MGFIPQLRVEVSSQGVHSTVWKRISLSRISKPNLKVCKVSVWKMSLRSQCGSGYH